MNKKLIITSMIAPLLFLTGCGFKLTDDILCEDGGIWKMKENSDSYIVIFKKDGTASISDANNVLESNHVSYTIDKNNEGYELNLDGEMIDISKKDQKEGYIHGSLDGENITFQKEDKKYLNHLKKSQQIAKQKEEEKERKHKEEINSNRKSVFSKVISSFKANGLNGEGKIDTKGIDVENFNVDDKDLEIENPKGLTFEISNNGKLKNNEQATVIVLDNGSQLYEQKITISGLTEYAKSVSDIKNIEDVKKKMDALCNKKTDDQKILRKAYFYYPTEGKFSMIYEAESTDEYTEGDISFDGFLTNSGIPFKDGKVSFPELNEDNTQSEDLPSTSFFITIQDKEERDETWNKAITALTKRGGEEFK